MSGSGAARYGAMVLSAQAPATDAFAMGVEQKTMTPHQYAMWYRKQQASGSAELDGAPTPEVFAERFAEKLATIMGRPVSSSKVGIGSHITRRCKHCNTNFENHGELFLKRHELQCGQRRCEHCCAVFQTPLQLRGHLAVCREHANNRCEFCGMRMVNLAQKKNHEPVCERNPALWCDWCGAQFPHRALRDRHQQACPKNPKRFCAHCHECFPSRMEAVVHAVFCAKNSKSCAESGTCVACCEQGRCIRFPCQSHMFCAHCLFQQVRIALKDRSMLPLRCCRQEVQPGDPVDLAVAQMLSETSREKYQEGMLLKSARDVMYCPRADCGSLIVLDELRCASLPLEGPHGCPKCMQALCFDCKAEWHAGMSCKQYQFMAASSRDAFTSFCRKMNWMRCFECGHVVEKKAGCNHITCICGAQFCYLCGAKWGDCKCQVVDQGHALRHNRAPLVDQQHFCRYCHQPYPSGAELRAHLHVCRTRIDMEGGAFECATCLSRFHSGEQLRNHLRACNLRCISCLSRFQSAERVQEHRLRGCRAAQDDLVACVDCQATFEDITVLRRHRKVCGVDLGGSC